MATSRKLPPPPEQLTLPLEELPARPSPTQESELDWMTRVVNSPSSLQGWLVELVRAGWSGKTFQASFLPGTESISGPSSGSLLNAGIMDAGELWTLRFSDSPNVVSVCSLSDILETGDHLQRYCLSARACQGILARAGRRGRHLPKELEAALRAASGQIPPEDSTPKTS